LGDCGKEEETKAPVILGVSRKTKTVDASTVDKSTLTVIE
jgi:hypothetical protein